MASYFVKQQDPNDPEKEVYVEVKSEELEIDPAVLEKKLFAHPKYAEVVGESVKRKKSIKELRAQLDKLAGEQGSEEVEEGAELPDKPKDGQQTVQPVAPLNKDELFEEFTARLAAKQQKDAEAKQSHAEKLKAIADKHGLGADALELLEDARNPEVFAEKLAKSKYQFDDQVGGAPAEVDGDALNAKIWKNLGLDGEK